MSNVTDFNVPPVVKTITVKCSPARAFRAFTAEAAKWWPLATHSMRGLGKKVEICCFEEHVGGRVYQRAEDGSEADWGRILAWDPPHRFAFSWLVNVAPEQAQTVAVEFTPVAEGTQVRLTHSGWEKLGEVAAAEARRRGYDEGWATVFEQCFRTYADSAT
jgi:uncharacterized protein YndB with AHSA1/START domain